MWVYNIGNVIRYLLSMFHVKQFSGSGSYVQTLVVYPRNPTRWVDMGVYALGKGSPCAIIGRVDITPLALFHFLDVLWSHWWE